MGKGKSRKSANEKALDVAGNPSTRAIVNLIPWLGSYFNDVLGEAKSRLAKERAGAFFGNLNRYGRIPTEQELHDNDLAHAVLETMRAATNAHNADKIQRLALLLSNYERVILQSGMSAYEEMLGILNDMTDREFQVLLRLRKHEEDDSPDRMRTMAAMPYSYWSPFQRDAEAMGIPPDELQGYLQRIARTGCVYMISNSATGQMARTTPIFRRLVAFVQPPGDKDRAPA